MREETISSIRAGKVIAIARGVPGESVCALAEALLAGGVTLMEITYDHSRPDGYLETDNAIKSLCREFKGEMTIGAGTVITMECLRRARDAGAEYIISPDMNPEIIRETRGMGLVSIPGALTPTEIMAAHRAGADFVKLFPAGEMGEAYMKAVRAPLRHIPLLAVGGITAENAPRFLAAGAVGLGVGGGLVNRELIKNGDFHSITAEARRLTRAING